jgi:hypothetical protein
MTRTLDIGCDDFAKAARNRQRVANHENIDFYLKLESWLRNSPLKATLPTWLTQGSLPQISKHDWQESGAGLHEEDL